MNFVKKLLSKRKLNDVLNQTKKLKIEGVIFVIRKINPIDYINGSKVMVKTFDEYSKSIESDSLSESQLKKIKQHFVDVFMAGVVKPKLSRKENCGEDIYVHDLFKSQEITDRLYQEIMYFTYGKKKLKSFISQEKR